MLIHVATHVLKYVGVRAQSCVLKYAACHILTYMIHILKYVDSPLFVTERETKRKFGDLVDEAPPQVVS